MLLFFALGISFPIVGLKVRARLSNVPMIKSSRQAKVIEITRVTWILTIVFICRSIVIAVMPQVISDFVWTEVELQQYFGLYCAAVVFYFFIFEAFPACTVLWNQHRLPPKLSVDFESLGSLTVNNLEHDLLKSNGHKENVKPNP